MNLELERVVKEYVENVNIVCKLMLQGLNLKSKEDLREYRSKHPYGKFELNGANEYCFHGRGCRFSNEKIMIDWDFGEGNYWCGINPGLLAYYVKTNYCSMVEYHTASKIEVEMENAVKLGKMKRTNDLYYFNSQA